MDPTCFTKMEIDTMKIDLSPFFNFSYRRSGVSRFSSDFFFVVAFLRLH